MASVGVQIDGLDEALSNLESLPDQVRGALADKLNKLALRGEEVAKQVIQTNDTSETGTLFSSVSVRKTARPTDLRAVLGAGGRGQLDGNEYAAAVEFGTDPFFPPVKAVTGTTEGLDRWVERTHKVTTDDPEKTAFLIARKIAERGIRAQPYMRPAFAVMKREAPRHIDDIEDDLNL